MGTPALAGLPQESAARMASAISPRFSTWNPLAANSGVAVVARVADVDTHVAPVVEVLLIGLLRAQQLLFHHESDGVEPWCTGLELLGVHQETAVAVDGQHRRVGAAELRAQRRREREPEPAQVEPGEQRERPRELQRRDKGVSRQNGRYRRPPRNRRMTRSPLSSLCTATVAERANFLDVR